MVSDFNPYYPHNDVACLCANIVWVLGIFRRASENSVG
jgi:hypothetical protein